MDKYKEGWASIHRKLINSDFWTSESFTKPQAWVDLIMLARHNDGAIWIKGKEIKLKRGQVARSELTLAMRWKWSRGKVRRFLKWLKSEQQIEQQKNSFTSVITVINYGEYQKNSTTNGTPDGHQTDIRRYNRRYTNNKGNNGNNENNKYIEKKIKNPDHMDFPEWIDPDDQ